MNVMIAQPTRQLTGITPARISPSSGWFEDEEERDNDLGPMPDESEGLVLRVLIPYMARSVDSGLPGLAPHGNGGLQCDQCGGWFGVTYWTCGACQHLGALATPIVRPCR